MYHPAEVPLRAGQLIGNEVLVLSTKPTVVLIEGIVRTVSFHKTFMDDAHPYQHVTMMWTDENEFGVRFFSIGDFHGGG